MINSDRIAQMKSSVLLINTSRGLLINEQQLADALNNGRIAGAGRTGGGSEQAGATTVAEMETGLAETADGAYGGRAAG
jgi:hypothetical protein